MKKCICCLYPKTYGPIKIEVSFDSNAHTCMDTLHVQVILDLSRTKSGAKVKHVAITLYQTVHMTANTGYARVFKSVLLATKIPGISYG